MPAEVAANKDLMRVFLPAIRGDYTAIDNYVYTEGANTRPTPPKSVERTQQHHHSTPRHRPPPPNKPHPTPTQTHAALPLPVPLVAFAGQNDDRAPPKRAEGWRRFAADPSRYSFDVFPGSHFFVKVSKWVGGCFFLSLALLVGAWGWCGGRGDWCTTTLYVNYNYQSIIDHALSIDRQEHTSLVVDRVQKKIFDVLG